MSRTMLWAVVALAVTASLAGCGGSHADNAGRASARAALRATNGVVIPADPTRIVSLSASATEDLFAVGAGRQVVAVDQYSTTPGAPRTKLSGYQPNVEAIAAYRPDLVIDDQDADHVAAHLHALGIPVLIDGAPSNLDGAYAQLERLGAATGHRLQALRVVSRWRAQVRSIVASVPRPRGTVSVYHELDQTFYSASSHTFLGHLYSLIGLRNVADKAVKLSPYPQLAAEYVIASDPDLIVLADTVCCGQSQRTLASRPGWSTIKAVRDHHVLAVNDSVASEWGPRIVQFLRLVAAEVRRLESHP